MQPVKVTDGATPLTWTRGTVLFRVIKRSHRCPGTALVLTQCFDGNLPGHRRRNVDADEVDVLVEQDVVRSAGVKGDAELLRQAARFLFALAPEGVDLEALGLQQRDQHPRRAPRAKNTDSRQHGGAAHRSFTCDP